MISLYAKGMATGDIAKHLAEVYDTDVSRAMVSRVTDKVLDEMQAWQDRTLDPVYPDGRTSSSAGWVFAGRWFWVCAGAAGSAIL